MIKTIKEIESRNKTKTHFYDEDDILVATEEDGEVFEIYGLTEEERKTIQEMI